MNRIEVKSVKVDITVLLKILKHAKEANFKQATGQLQGLYFKEREEVEISNCYAIPLDDEDLSSDVYDGQMMKNLEEVNMESNKVGWYQISYANDFLDESSVATMLEYQNSIGYGIYLVYDILEAERGSRNPFKAFRINKSFFENFGAKEKVKISQLRNFNYKMDKIYDEIKVEILKNPLTKAFLYEQSKAFKKSIKGKKSDVDLNAYFERTIKFLSENLEEQNESNARIFAETDKALKGLKKEEKESNFELGLEAFIDNFARRHKINNFQSKILNCGKLQLENAFLLGELFEKQKSE
mmetsp:Transcript_56177/g.64457  ORF Transcript_56177/g.64457 Transcript_56177/m.64457 type:complete len:298 (-) Transcript_56177:167-1060(-)